MAKMTIGFGVLLIVLGVIGYMGAGSPPPEVVGVENGEAAAPVAEDGSKKSVTALIPAFVGAILAFCGVVALQEKLRMHAMHAAVVVGLLGCLAGLGRGVMGLGKFVSGDPSLNQRSFFFVWMMAVICGVFVFLCVKSFIDARKQRQAEAAAGSANTPTTTPVDDPQG